MSNGASAEMPRYKCHKEVHALKIKRVEVHAGGDGTLFPENPIFAKIEVQSDWITQHKPFGAGYYVVYADGYKSWSPVEAFESGYTRIGA